MNNRVRYFAIATLLPTVLLVPGGIYGGAWLWGALAYLTIVAATLDMLMAFGSDPEMPEREFPAATGLSVSLAVAHFALLGLAVWSVSGGTGLSGPEVLGAFFAFGLMFGQVSNSNAHELIHRSGRLQFELGKWVFISHLFGHHVSAHRLVHHRHVGTGLDPNSAPAGMGFYRFVLRAWAGSFRSGYRAERSRLEASGTRRKNPYVIYISGGITMLVLAGLIGDLKGILAYIALAGYATMQILLSDYVQHYGLRRPVTEKSDAIPDQIRHSWDAPHSFSRLIMLNAPRHSDHHDHPARPFPALGLPDTGLMLPHSLPVMAVIALFPRLWRRVMDARLPDQADE